MQCISTAALRQRPIHNTGVSLEQQEQTLNLLQVQDQTELKASDIVQFVLQTDARSKERQAARITRLKVHSTYAFQTMACSV